MKVFNIDFMRWRRIAGITSGVIVLVSVGALTVSGLNFGLDFTGGTLVEVGYPEPVAPETVRLRLEAAGYENAVVQNFGTDRDLLIRGTVAGRRGPGDAG